MAHGPEEIFAENGEKWTVGPSESGSSVWISREHPADGKPLPLIVVPYDVVPLLAEALVRAMREASK